MCSHSSLSPQHGHDWGGECCSIQLLQQPRHIRARARARTASPPFLSSGLDNPGDLSAMTTACWAVY